MAAGLNKRQAFAIMPWILQSVDSCRGAWPKLQLPQSHEVVVVHMCVTSEQGSSFFMFGPKGTQLRMLGERETKWQQNKPGKPNNTIRLNNLNEHYDRAGDAEEDAGRGSLEGKKRFRLSESFKKTKCCKTDAEVDLLLLDYLVILAGWLAKLCVLC